MTLKLITGAANAGKTGVVLRDARQARDAGLAPILVVPGLADVRRLEAEFAEKQESGIRVLTMEQLIRDGWSLYGDGRRIVGRFTREAMLGMLIERELGLPRETISPGFPKMAARVAQDWAWSWDLGAGATAREWGERDLCQVVGRYYAELSRRGLIELWSSARALVSAGVVLDGPVSTLRGDTLGVDHLRFLLGLSAGNRVTVGFTWEDGLEATRGNSAMVKWLLSRCHERADLAEEISGAEIPRMARRLFSGGGGLRGGGAVRFAVVSGSEEECAAAAGATVEAIASGVPAERIMVAFPRLSHRGDAVSAAFRAAGVPVGVRGRRSVGVTGFGRAFLGLLSLAARTGSRAEASQFALSAYSGIDDAEARRLDRRWRTGRVRDPRALLSDIAGASPSAANCVRLAEAATTRTIDTRSAMKWQDLADALLDLAIQRGESDSEHDLMLGAEYSEVSLGISEMAATPTELAPSPPGAIAALGARQVAGFGEERDGEVQVCEVADVGARRFDVVIVGGMTEDEFAASLDEGPAGTARPCFDGLAEPDPAELARLQFYSLVTRARSKVVLIRQDSDSEGGPKRAAALWQDAVDVYRPAGMPAGEDAEGSLVTLRLTQAELPSVAPALTAGRAEARRGAGHAVFGQPERSRLSEELAARVTDRPISATEVEAYLACPYQWFYQRVVRPAEIDTEVDAREIGVQAHDVLAAFYSSLRDSGIRRVTEAGLQDAVVLLEEVIVSRRRRVAVDGSVAEEMSVARAERWARNVVGQDAAFMPGFAPAHTEFSFGDGEPFDFAGARFHGRIDRIDTTSELAFVTDYKSSRDVTGLARFEREGKVQAVIYALAAEQSLGGPVCGSAYRSMSSGDVAGYWREDLLGEMPTGMCADEGLDEAGFAELVARTAQSVEEALAGMRAGAIPRRPRTGACKYCPVRAVCEAAVA